MIRLSILLIGFLVTALSLKAQNVVIPAEFEKNEGLILKWNYNPEIDSTLIRIASIISPDDKVWILFDPANPVTTTAIQSQLSAQGVNLSNVFFIEGAAENPWLRDYGPASGYYTDDLGETRHFVDAQYLPSQFPLADFLPVQLTSDFGFNYEALPLNFEFGNLQTDAIGRGFVGDKVLSANPGMNANEVIQSLYMKLNLNEIIILPSLPGCGGGEGSELSRLVKFIDPGTVLVSQFPSSYPLYQQVEMLADTLSRTFSDVGKPLMVVRLPVSPNANGTYSTTNDGEIRSYTSSIIFNNKILIPSFGSDSDATALTVYQQQFPGHQVFQVPSQALTMLHGSLFRLAVNIPQPKMLRIRHSQFSGPLPYENELWVNTFVQSSGNVDSIQIFSKILPASSYQVVNTIGCCGGNSASIAGYSISDTISYYIKAYVGEQSQTLPIGAPEATFTFWFDPFTGLSSDNSGQEQSFYPNPASDFINLKGIARTDPDGSYEVCDMKGVTVASGKIQGETSIRLPAALANGFYVIKINPYGKTHISKLYLHR